MFGKLFTTIMVKSIAKDSIVLVVKKSNQHNKSVVQEKLGVSTIDEFMRMDIKDLCQKAKG